MRTDINIGKHWIECGVSPGMFSNEYVVEVSGRSYFVEENSVRNVEGDRGELWVTIIERDDRKWAILPTSAREMVLIGDASPMKGTLR